MLCLFDLDGTLIDSEPGITACIQHAFDKLGVPAPTELRVSASSIWRHPLPIPRTALKASAKAVQSLRRRHSSTP